MNSSPEFRKKFEDPLYATLKRSNKKKETIGRAEPNAGSRGGAGGRLSTWLMLAMGGVLIGLGTYLYQTQQHIQQLTLDLTRNQVHLEQVSSDLGNSQEQIGSLREGLSESESQISVQQREITRYKSLYSDVQTQQQQQERELETLSVRKADQSQVQTLKEESEQIRHQVSATQVNVSELREVATRNQVSIEGQRQQIETVAAGAESTARELAAVKQSLQREVYNFELYEGGPIMKVFDIALSLKNIDFSRQRYNLDIIAGDQRVRKTNQAISEPIYFYIKGESKPYELVINKIDKKYVVGHLSVPAK